MKLTEICINRPVFATMLIVSLVILGLVSFAKLGVDLYPKVDIPTVTVTTQLEGASPEEIETQVTKPLEEAINTISGIDDLRSSSIEGMSQVYASFVLEKDLDEAVNDVRQKVSASISKLPEHIDSPVIEKVDPDASPVLSILLSGKRSAREISEIADKVIKRQIEIVRDVGSVTLVGDRKREIQILIDPNKLFAYNLSIEDVKQAVKNQNVEIPAGRLTWKLVEKGLRTLGKFDNVPEISNLIVADYKQAPVRLKDIGCVVDGTEEARSISRVNGKNGIALLVRKQSGSNTIEVVNRVNKRVDELKKLVPKDIELSIVRDQSRFIRKSIEEVEKHLVLGAILASLVVLFFMRNIKAALIASVSIPVSIISTFMLMKYMGFTINNLTLLALSICTGIVIDDAIIVLENIFRYIEEKNYLPRDATLAATKEIAGAVLATTLSLVVIFMPIAFMYGVVGRFFNSFGLTAVFAIVISMFVAFTLIPTLVNRLFKQGEFFSGNKTSKDAFFFRTISHYYDIALKWSLNHRLTVIFIAILIVITTPFIFKMIKFEFFPYDDMSEYEVIIQTQPGSSLEETDIITNKIENEIRKLPSIKDVFTTIGVKGLYKSSVTDVSIYVALEPLEKRTIPQDVLMQKTRLIIKKYPGLRSSVQYVGTISGGGMRQTPFNLLIQGRYTEKLDEYANKIIAELSKIPGYVDLDTAEPDVSPEVKVKINRNRASDLGINIWSIANALNIMIGGEKISTYREGSEQYDIRLRLEEQFRKNEENVKELPIRTASGTLVRLENVASTSEGKSPSQINHYNLEREVTVISNLENLALGQAIEMSKEIVEKLHIPSDYKTYYIGMGKVLGEAVPNFLLATILSITFIYIVLAAQFDRYTQPLIIMASIPLSIPFALLSLWITNQSLNIDSMIGILLLFGIVKKNAILQVDYTNTLVKQGKPVNDAIIEADHARLRPILMTTFTIIAGMLPIALGKGDGSAPRATMATLIVGGQAMCLFITLLVTPVLYSLAADIKTFIKEKIYNHSRKISEVLKK